MTTPDRHVPLRSVELHILLGVADRPRHGYAILQEAEDRTDGHPGFEIPTLYRALRRLHDDGLIRTAEAPEEEADERREYWGVTELGRETLQRELERLEVALVVGRARLGESGAGGVA